MSRIDSIIKCAEKYRGIKEGSDEHWSIIERYNDNRDPDASQIYASSPWCAAFVGAVFAEVGGKKAIPIDAYCPRMVLKFKSKGQWKAVNPEPGDVIFYSWHCDGSADHVGIVKEVADGKITAIEGNYNDTVMYRIKFIGDREILGFGMPDYREVPDEFPFKDVYKDDWYYDAVCWAYRNGITSGTDSTHFSPSAPASRAEVVQMLYKASQKK